MNISTQDVLLLTAGSIGFELLVFARLLVGRGLFHWLSAGFWAWASFLLYYVVTPLSAILSGDLFDFQVRLQVGGGASRGIWVAIVLLVGIAAFFAIYLKTKPHSVRFGIKEDTPTITPIFLYWLALFVGFGLYALLASRAGLANWQGNKVIEGGRFVGDVTGYQNAGYMLLFYPIAILLLWPHRFGRSLGLVLAAAFVIFSLPHAWSRFATLSMLLALSMWYVSHKNKRWPNGLILAAFVIIVLIYQARGHETWQYKEIPQAIADSWEEVGTKRTSSLAESDTQMLPTFWVESAWRDNWVGYNYGLPFLNYMLTGWIPGRFLPQKYFLVNWVAAQRPVTPIFWSEFLYGAKSSLIGSFYANGNLLAVILQMALAGWLSRRLDGMLVSEAPIAVRALGIALLSVLWMVWGSSDVWGLMLLGTMAIPFLFGIPIFRIKARMPRSALRSSGQPNKPYASRTQIR